MSESQTPSNEFDPFPLGCTLDRGRYRIVERLRGHGEDRGMYRASDRDGDSGQSLLVTLGPRQRLPPAELEKRFRFPIDGVTPLRYIGPLETTCELQFTGLVEDEPTGVPASQAFSISLEPDSALRLALAIAKTIERAHAAGFALAGLRPELVYVSQGSLVSLAPRCDRFLSTAQRPFQSAVACFDNWYHAPEALANPAGPALAPADVFSLCAVLAHWVSGEHPFEGFGSMQILSIVAGRRRAWRGDPQIGALVDAGLANVAERLSLLDLIGGIEQLIPRSDPSSRRYVLRDGTRIDEAGWSERLRDPVYVAIDETKLANGYVVSTVWTGVDHDPFANPPTLFESMVLDHGTGVDRIRYHNERAAREGHRGVVEKWSALSGPKPRLAPGSVSPVPPALRCPRCANTDITGRTRTFRGGADDSIRTIEERFCPRCGLLESADSTAPDYLQQLARWRT